LDGAGASAGESQAGGDDELAEATAQAAGGVRRLRIGSQELETLGGEQLSSLDVNRVHGASLPWHRVS
jgi:hypothetical protein